MPFTPLEQPLDAAEITNNRSLPKHKELFLVILSLAEDDSKTS